MAKFTVEKTKNYTTMSNRHFQDKRLSYKAKGLLSLMLSLPEEWDYSVQGLMKLSRDGKDSVMAGINELEDYGYLIRTQEKDESGRFTGYNYSVYEHPFSENPSAGKPLEENPTTVNPQQLNNNKLNTNELKTEASNNCLIKETHKRKNGGKPENRNMEEVFEEFIEDRFSSVVDSSALHDAVNDFIDHRADIKKKLTPTALKLNLEKAYRLAEGDYDRTCELILNAVANGWQGIYDDPSYSRRSQSSQFSQGRTMSPDLRYSNDECRKRLETEEVPF